MRTFLHIAVFLLLTILTQIGGLVYLLTLYVFRRPFKDMPKWRFFKIPFFIGTYLLTTLFFIPLLSSRVPLPMGEQNGLRPVTMMTCLLNRHYVDPELKAVLLDVSSKFRSTIQYMDANFPFFDGFPLLPHLSHDDGKKIDLAFQYGTGGTDLENLRLPTFIGYGSFELPEEEEENRVEQCQENGAWQYSITEFIPSRSTEATFHHYRTQKLVNQLAKHPGVRKIFIEPHLKKRMGLKSPKIRFHGCHAVRHDDHIHVELGLEAVSSN